MKLKRFACLLALMLAVCAIPVWAQEEEEVRGDVPYVPTPENVVAAMLKMANVHKGDVLFDLGSGDGRIVITAAKQFGIKGVGVDINPVRIKEANENAKSAGVTDLVEFHRNDLFQENISKASVVTLYLLPSINLKLRPKLMKELKPGTRIVSHDFDMGEWKPLKEEEMDGHKVYFWVIPPDGPEKDKLMKSDQ